MKFKKIIPKEQADLETLVRWMDAKHLRFTHIPNENVVTRDRKFAAILGAKRKRSGVSRGFPDLMIVIPARPPQYAEDRNRPASLLFIELKRQNGVPSNVAPEQNEWLACLGEIPNVAAVVAFGYDQAVREIERRMTSRI